MDQIGYITLNRPKKLNAVNPELCIELSKTWLKFEQDPEARIAIFSGAGKDEAYLESLAHTNPINRFGDAEDIAEAVLFLLRSDFVTGQVVFVDGGRHMHGRMYG